MHCPPLWRTRVGGEPAAVVDYSYAGGTRRLREWRILHGGRIYGSALIYSGTDVATLDVILAAMQQWTWTTG